MAVRLAELSLAALADMDARIEALFQHHLSRIANDCRDRPGDDSARVLTLKFSIVPVADPMDASTCEDITLDVTGDSSLPKHKTKTFRLKVASNRAGTKLLYNQDIPEDADQTAIQFDKD